MTTQSARAEAFRALHARPRIFAIPNPWDAGSAKLLASLGFEALATTSAGLAFSLGKPDGENALSRDETLANARAIVAATPLPVSADLENCFGDAPQRVPRPFVSRRKRVSSAARSRMRPALPIGRSTHSMMPLRASRRG